MFITPERMITPKNIVIGNNFEIMLNKCAPKNEIKNYPKELIITDTAINKPLFVSSVYLFSK